ncbi:uncharacterized protein TNCV_914981 [Trichonephila clavipes]|uniref:Uncharacterized protein n=1 Tax=Trichonephila clavipes TaxID=2585209 RepID=A0A8X6RIL2_TRICX|nr:uncharacterized protein TNCV_914981 [Trichonephila clavipes]
MPETIILPRIRDLFGDDSFFIEQDGTPTLYLIDVWAYLDNVVPGHWIGQSGPTGYPARLPYLIALDFYLWNYLKNAVYINKPRTLEG